MSFISRIKARFSKPKPTPKPNQSFPSTQAPNQSTPPQFGGTQTLAPTGGGGGSSSGGRSGGSSGSSGGGSSPNQTKIPNQSFPTSNQTKAPKEIIRKNPSGGFIPIPTNRSNFVNALDKGKELSGPNQTIRPTQSPFINQSYASFADLGGQESVESTTPKKFSYDSAKTYFNKQDDFFQSKTTTPFFNKLESQFGITPATLGTEFGRQAFPNTTKNIFVSQLVAPGKSFESTIKGPREFTGGIIKEQFEDIRDNPLGNLATYGAGRGVSIGLKAVGVGFSLIPGTAGKIIRPTVKVAEVGGGIAATGYFGYQTGKSILTAPTPSEKGGALGLAIKDVSLFGGGIYSGSRGASSRGIDKAADLFRTRGRTNVPATDVIAPEFYKGQTYPKVKTGTTARELKAEFNLPALPGELAGTPRSFSATGVNIQGSTKIKPGTSEVFGLFSAPKLSPKFLRVGGESPGFKLFGLTSGSLDANLPTALRLNLGKIEYAKGITGSTIVGTGKGSSKATGNRLTTFKGFFESVKGSGRTFLPAAKTEKEVITGYDSLIKQTGRKNFFNFGGRKVPINEFEIVGGASTNNLFNKPSTIKDVFGSSYGRGSGKVSLINPYGLSASSGSNRGSGGSSSSIFNQSSTFSNISKPSKPSRGGSSGSSPPRINIPSSLTPTGSSSGRPPTPSSFFPPSPPTRRRPPSRARKQPPPTFKIPSFNFRVINQRRPRTKSPRLNFGVGRIPTFDALGLGIYGRRKAQGESIGAGSLVTRPILRGGLNGRKRKKKKKR